MIKSREPQVYGPVGISHAAPGCATRQPKRRQAKKQSAEEPTALPNVSGVYLNTVEAARYLNLSRQFLERARHVADGSGPKYIKLERAVRYRRTDLDAWMAAHDHAADKPATGA